MLLFGNNLDTYNRNNNQIMINVNNTHLKKKNNIFNMTRKSLKAGHFIFKHFTANKKKDGVALQRYH